MDQRRANFIMLTADKTKLDYQNVKYIDIRFSLQAIQKIVVSDAFEANLPGIAYQLWGDPDFKYWWALGLYNGIVDPIEDVVTGLELLIPSIDDIKKYLNSEDEQVTFAANNANVVTL